MLKIALTRLSTGRILSSLLIVGLLAGIGSLIVGTSSIANAVLRAVSMVSFSGFSLFFLYWVKRFGGSLLSQFRALNREIRGIKRTLNSVHSASKKGISAEDKKMMGLTQASSANRESNSNARKIANDNFLSNKTSLYELGSIPPSRVIAGTSSKAVGRHAASMTMEADGQKVLHRLLTADNSRWKRNIAFVGRSNLKKFLSQVARVTELRPYLSQAQASEKFDVIVLEEAAFSAGLWAGALDASRTNLLLEIHKTIVELKKRGTLVILVELETTSTFTGTLRDLSDFCIGGTHTELESGLELVKQIQSFRDRESSDV